MCKVVADAQGEEAIAGSPNKMIYLSWSIKNDSKTRWPRYPILRNVTTSQRVQQYIKPEKYSPDLLVKAQLDPDQVFDLHYEFKLPKNLPNGVFILKFQMIDPLITLSNLKNENTDKPAKDEKFGDVINVTIDVKDGNLGELQGAQQSEQRGIAGLMAEIDNDEEGLDFEDPDNGFEIDESAFMKNIKIGDYDLDQIDALVDQGEQDLQNFNYNISNLNDSMMGGETSRQTDLKEKLMKQEQDQNSKKLEEMKNMILESKQSILEK